MRDKYGFHSHGMGSELFTKETAKEGAIVGAIVIVMAGVGYKHRHDGEVQHRGLHLLYLMATIREQ